MGAKQIIGFSGPGGTNVELRDFPEIPRSKIEEVELKGGKAGVWELSDAFDRLNQAKSHLFIVGFEEGSNRIKFGFAEHGFGQGQAESHFNIGTPRLVPDMFHGEIKKGSVDKPGDVELDLHTLHMDEREKQRQYVELSRFLIEHGISAESRISDDESKKLMRLFHTDLPFKTLADVAVRDYENRGQRLQ